LKITKISWSAKKLGLKRPYKIAYKTVSDVEVVFFELELANGIRGVGSSNPSKHVVGQDTQDVIQSLQSIDFTFLESRDIEEFYALVEESRLRFRKMPGVLACVDIALHDAFTQFLKIPLGKFLGRRRAALFTSVTIGISDINDTLKETREHIEEGFKILKVKTGLDPELDAERIIKIFEKYPEIKVRVDANQGYKKNDLVKFLTLTKDYRPELIEQPFHVENFNEFLRGFDEDIRGLIAADESIRNPEDAIKLAGEKESCGIFNIKLMKCGGISEGSIISQVSRLAKKELMWGCNDESCISISAALNLALSQPNTHYLDLDGSFDLEQDICEGGFKLSAGKLFPLDTPGLGLQF